jgi:RHS repeat-associated protein
LSWDGLGQLAAIQGQASFIHDGTGQRVQKSIAGVVTQTPFEAVRHVFPSNQQTFRIFFGGVVIGEVRTDSSGVRQKVHVHVDRLGSIRATTDGAGNVLQRHSDRPWGDGVWSEGTGFTGQEHDAATGLIYMGARYYDPLLRRFISPDGFIPNPFHSPKLNPYSYVENDPINAVDPTGRFTFWIPLGPVSLGFHIGKHGLAIGIGEGAGLEGVGVFIGVNREGQAWVGGMVTGAGFEARAAFTFDLENGDVGFEASVNIGFDLGNDWGLSAGLSMDYNPNAGPNGESAWQLSATAGPSHTEGSEGALGMSAGISVVRSGGKWGVSLTGGPAWSGPVENGATAGWGITGSFGIYGLTKGTVGFSVQLSFERVIGRVNPLDPSPLLHIDEAFSFSATKGFKVDRDEGFDMTFAWGPVEYVSRSSAGSG